MKTIYRLLLFVLIFWGFAISCQHDSQNKKSQNESDIPSLEELNVEIAKDPNNADLFYQRAKYFLKNENFNNALKDIDRAMMFDPTNTDYYILLSGIYLSMGNYEESINTLREASEIDPQNKDINKQLSIVYLILEQFEMAIRYQTKAINIDPLDPDLYYYRSYQYYEIGDTLSAINDLQKSIEIDPEYFGGYYMMGVIYRDLGDPIAMDYLKTAVRIDAENIDAMYTLGHVYQTFANFEQALELYEQILAKDSAYFNALFNIGYINLVYSEDFEKAINYFSKTIAIIPDNYDAFYNRGLCYELIGDLENARLDYENTLKFQTNYEDAINGLNRLDDKSKNN